MLKRSLLMLVILSVSASALFIFSVRHPSPPPLQVSVDDAATPTRRQTKSFRPNADYLLDGYCPVALLETQQWREGDVRFRESHGVHVVLLADEAAWLKFRQSPDDYLPLFYGYDVVIAKVEKKLVLGKRQFGITHQRRLLLFNSQDNLHKFARDPQPYLEAAKNDLPFPEIR